MATQEQDLGQRKHLPVKEFPINRELLSPEEQGVLSVLEEAARDIAPIFVQQVREGFYPRGASGEEIELAAQREPAILSPYTLVERDEKGNLIAVPSHEKYRAHLEPVSQRLLEAARLTPNPQFQKYLELRAQGLLDGNYEESEAYRLQNNLFSIDIVIGPYDVYLDNRFNLKFAYQAWVGILDTETTEYLQKFVKSAPFETDDKTRVRIRVDDTVLFAGLAAERGWSGNSLPCQPEWRDKYGSLFTIFLPSFDEKFRLRRLPIIRNRIAEPLHQDRSDEKLRQAALHFLALHETSHSFARRKGDQQRLGSTYATLNEMYCDILALSAALQHPWLDQGEKQDFLVGFFGWSIADAHSGKPRPTEKPYALSDSVIMNFLIERAQVLKVEGGQLSWENTMEMKEAIDSLEGHLNYLISYSKRGEAERIIRDYGKPSIGERFCPEPPRLLENPTKSLLLTT